MSIGFVEIGCKPKGKNSQLKNKRELFYKYWGDNYRYVYGIDWLPRLYRILAHYSPNSYLPLDYRKYSPDLIIMYSYIDEIMLSQITEEERKEIYRIAHNQKDKDLLEEIILTRDSERLHNLIIEGHNEYSLLRGKIAEIFVLKDLEQNLPSEMRLFRNSEIHYFNKRYKNGTEIDGILFFYGKEIYKELVNSLKKIEHINIRP